LETWFGLSPATMIFNEAITHGWLKQPANAWTNVFYILNSLFLLILYIQDEKRNLALIFIVISFLVGLTSFLYHASNAYFFQFFDLASMYLLSGFMLSLVLVRLDWVKPGQWPVVFLLTFGGSAALTLMIRGKSGALIFGMECLLILLLEGRGWRKSRGKTSYRYFVSALILLAVSFVFWVLDYNRLLFIPENHFIQGHGLWHILNSFCFLLLFLFYRQFNKHQIGI
jgi:hypothetical protein